MVIWVMEIFFVLFFRVFLPPLLNIVLLLLDPCHFCPLLCPSLNVPLVSLIFLKRSLVFPILLLPSISLHWSLRKAFLFLLAILWNCEFRWIYLSFCLLLLFFSQLFVSPPQTIILFFLCFFFLGMVLIMASCTMLWTSIHSCSGTLSIRSNALNLFVTSPV